MSINNGINYFSHQQVILRNFLDIFIVSAEFDHLILLVMTLAVMMSSPLFLNTPYIFMFEYVSVNKLRTGSLLNRLRLLDSRSFSVVGAIFHWLPQLRSKYKCYRDRWVTFKLEKQSPMFSQPKRRQENMFFSIKGSILKICPINHA